MTDKQKAQDRIIIDQLGAIIVILGIAELCWGLYAAPKGQFKLNFGLLLLGLLILFGNMRIVSGVRWLAWLALAPAVLMLIMPFLTTPAGLIRAELRLAPLQFAVEIATSLLLLALIIAVIRRLGSAPVQAARASAGRKQRDMRIPLAIGVVIAAVMQITATMTLNGDNARKAEQLVANRMGPNYQYHTNFLGIFTGDETYVQATVQAWNENELLLIPVQWHQ